MGRAARTRVRPAPDFVGELDAVKYSGISFTFYGNGRIASFVAYGDGARTSRGVEVGDPLDRARSTYGGACKPEIETESDVIVAQCWKRLGPGRHIAFAAFDGSDKIGSIAVSADIPKRMRGGWLCSAFVSAAVHARGPDRPRRPSARWQRGLRDDVVVSRVLLVLASALALLVGTIWWLFSGLLVGSHSACEGTASAHVAFVFSHFGLLLSAGALVAAFVADRIGMGWWCLGIYAFLLAISALIFLSCG